MEPEQPSTQQEPITQAESAASSLHQVTPVSKYLAMALFIILPFVGGYIGYLYGQDDTSLQTHTARESSELTNVDDIQDTLANRDQQSVMNADRDDVVPDQEQSAAPNSEGTEDARDDIFYPHDIFQYYSIIINDQQYSSSTEASLSYDQDTFYINTEPIFTTADGTFELYTEPNTALNYYFLRLGHQHFGMRFMDLGSVSLFTLPQGDPEAFESIGYGYARYNDELYYVSAFDALQPFETSEQYEFITLEAVLPEAVLIIGNNVYHRGKWLEGLEASELQIKEDNNKPRGYALTDTDTAYLQEVDCHLGRYYVEKEFADIDSWRPGC